MPELGPDTKFVLSSHKAVNEYKEAKEVRVPCFFNSYVLCIFKQYIYILCRQIDIPGTFAAWSEYCSSTCWAIYLFAVGETRQGSRYNI